MFLPYIPHDDAIRPKAERKLGWNEGPAFRWPNDRPKILEHIRQHRGDELYFSACIFRKRFRREEADPLPVLALFSDLDEVQPRKIETRYRPTVVWETSPGRYQAMWLLDEEADPDVLKAGGINQRLTYAIGADKGGWMASKALRVPGQINYKADYLAQYGEHPVGRLVWDSPNRTYLADDFRELPEVLSAQTLEGLEGDVDKVDFRAVLRQATLKRATRRLIGAHDTEGRDRSEVEWQLARDLADAGLTPVEIAAVVRSTVWNKYDGRSDEVSRLLTTASRAYEERVTEPETIEEVTILDEGAFGLHWTEAFSGIKRPTWIVKGVWTLGSVGFISAEPKSYKTWTGYDLAVSVATGLPFLGHFPVYATGPVLYIQNEDPAELMKVRWEMIAEGKGLDVLGKMHWTDDGMVEWAPPKDRPPVYLAIDTGWDGTNPTHRDLLKEQIEKVGFRMVIVDTLSRTIGDLDLKDPTEVIVNMLGPLSRLAHETKCAIAVIHHSRKGTGGTGRGGQRMLGSGSLHAWAESAIYFGDPVPSDDWTDLPVEREAKNATPMEFQLRVPSRMDGRWAPVVGTREDPLPAATRNGDGPDGREDPEDLDTDPKDLKSQILGYIRETGSDVRNKDLCSEFSLDTGRVARLMARLEKEGKVKKVGRGAWRPISR